MKFVIEFYRTREADSAHAVIGRETANAADLDGAIAIAHQLLRTLSMPQRPDAMSLSDGAGRQLYATTFAQAAGSDGQAVDQP